MSKSEVPISCRCGGTQFEFPSNNPRPNDTIKCVKCGATGRYADIQKSAVDQVKKQIEKTFKDAFKKFR